MWAFAGILALWILSGIPLARARRALPPEQREAVRARHAGPWYALLPVLMVVGFLVAWVSPLEYMGTYIAAVVIPLSVSYLCLTIMTARKIRRAGAPPAYFRTFLLGTFLQLPMLAMVLWMGASKG